MPMGEICNREVIVVQRDDTVLEAAKLMRQHRGVGDVQVVDDRDGERVPVGIITDHDLVVEIMAAELDYMVITVGDVIDLHAV